MSQSTRVLTSTAPYMEHDFFHDKAQKVESYGGTDAWVWPQFPTTQHPSFPNGVNPQMYTKRLPQSELPTTHTPPWHHSTATTHVHSTVIAAPPPRRSQGLPNPMEAQPVFDATWHGFLDTTKDAMTIVEAVLRGRLSCVSSRLRDKKQAEVLSSGTVLVYKENASGIKRWTDTVSWSPSRTMENYLIYRQLVGPMKPRVKKMALNQSCGTKRKRGKRLEPTITKTGESYNNSEGEFEGLSSARALTREPSPMIHVYTNFARSLTPDQQRRFCGSLIDSHDFKERGLMKKTISVKYLSTRYRVISYYSLEDAVYNKLRRPCQDDHLADIYPRHELLSSWKVSSQGDKDQDQPLVSGFKRYNEPRDLQHYIVETNIQDMGHGLIQDNVPLQVHDYWPGLQDLHSAANQSSPHHYSSQPVTQQYSTQQPLTQPSISQNRYRDILPSCL
jgi:hypothetical protein